MTYKYLGPGKGYEFVPERDIECVCENERVCDCEYDPVRGYMDPYKYEFDVEQDEE